jgi:membrane dipeptidase
MNRTALRGSIALLALALAGCGTKQLTEEQLVAKARDIHSRILTIDTHVDISGNFATPENDPGVRGNHQVDLVKMREGGLDAVFWAVYVGQGPRTPEGYSEAEAEARAKFAALHRVPEMYPDEIALATTPDDVVRIHDGGKLVECIGIENGYAIGQSLDLLRDYYQQGARYMTLTHNGHNDIGDSSDPLARLGDNESEYGGLSDFGKQVVQEMNRIGMMVDVSHVAKSTMLDAVRLSRAPVIASHSAVKALADVSRNLDDEQLLALEENGGVVQVVALASFDKVDPPEKTAAQQAIREEMGLTDRAAFRSLTDEQRAEYRRRMQELDEQWPRANVQDFVNHIDYAVKLIGIDHVGISSDFDGGGGVVGYQDASEAFNVTLELVRRGYSEEEIAKLWGGNLLRVWREVDRVAKEMQGE